MEIKARVKNIELYRIILLNIIECRIKNVKNTDIFIFNISLINALY